MNINDILRRNGIQMRPEKVSKPISSYAENFLHICDYKKYDINIENSNLKFGINELISNKISIRGESQNPLEDIKEIGSDIKTIGKAIWKFIKDLFNRFIAWIRKTRYNFKMKRYHKSVKYVIKTVLDSERSEYDLPKWTLDPNAVSVLKDKIEELNSIQNQVFPDLEASLKKKEFLYPAGAKSVREAAEKLKPTMKELNDLIDGLPKDMITFTEESDDKLTVIKQTCGELFKTLESLTSEKNSDKAFVITKLSEDIVKHIENHHPEDMKAEDVKIVGNELQSALNIVKEYLSDEDKVLSSILKGWMKMTTTKKEYNEKLNPGEPPKGYVKSWDDRKQRREDRKAEKRRVKETRKNNKKKKDIIID
nr:MAG TPA: hypothetical protein [Caudoviricetes sp.]